MRIAVIHDWLVTYAGAERVLEQILACFPDADVFSLVDFVPTAQRAFLGSRTVRTSFLQHLPFARTKYRSYLALMPLAIEQFELGSYDLVISSSHAVAKGVLTGPHQLHLCYCHTPIRYAWDLQAQYLREAKLEHGLRGAAARLLLHGIRNWDARTALGVDAFAANSRFIQQRIWKVYRRESEVIYPPVDTTAFAPHAAKEDFYVTASRMVPYKRVGLIVDAFAAMPERRLVVIGDGPDRGAIAARAPANVTLMGFQPFDVLRDHLQRARAFVFAAEEDFGIAPVEAQACGTPVIALGRGGTAETIRGLETAAPTGVLFGEQDVSSIVNAVNTFERDRSRFSLEACVENARRFGIARFRAEVASWVEHGRQDSANRRRHHSGPTT